MAVPGVDGNLIGHLCIPPNSSGPRPAVVVLPELDGFCPGTVAAAQRLSDAGYVALGLDLYAPYGGVPVLRDGADAKAWLRRIDDSRQVSDLAKAIAWLGLLPEVDEGRIGSLGFSIGGRYALMLATQSPLLLAVATMYTRPWPTEDPTLGAMVPGKHVGELRVPVCAIFGVDDHLVPIEMAEQFSTLLADQGHLAHESHLVPGHHMFANEGRSRYLPDSADAAWGFVFDFFALHLMLTVKPGFPPGSC